MENTEAGIWLLFEGEDLIYAEKEAEKKQILIMKDEPFSEVTKTMLTKMLIYKGINFENCKVIDLPTIQEIDENIHQLQFYFSSQAHSAFINAEKPALIQKGNTIILLCDGLSQISQSTEAKAKLKNLLDSFQF